MCNLGIEHKVTNQIELANQGGGVFAEVVEYLHYLI